MNIPPTQQLRDAGYTPLPEDEWLPPVPDEGAEKEPLSAVLRTIRYFGQEAEANGLSFKDYEEDISHVFFIKYQERIRQEFAAGRADEKGLSDELNDKKS